MPLEEFSVGPVGSPIGRRNRLARRGSCVELLSVAELSAQPRADEEAEFRIDSEVAAIEESVHIGPEQESVVETVLTTLRQWA